MPGAPIPDPQKPSPARFLPEYDNVLLGHADRSRIISPETKLWTEVGWGTVLVDGFTAARWRLEPENATAILKIEPLRALSRADRKDVSEEGARLAAFLLPEAGTPDVRIVRAGS